MREDKVIYLLILIIGIGCQSPETSYLRDSNNYLQKATDALDLSIGPIATGPQDEKDFYYNEYERLSDSSKKYWNLYMIEENTRKRKELLNENY